MIMKQNENDEVSKCQKWNKYYPTQHDVSPVYGLFQVRREVCQYLLGYNLLYRSEGQLTKFVYNNTIFIRTKKHIYNKNIKYHIHII